MTLILAGLACSFIGLVLALTVLDYVMRCIEQDEKDGININKRGKA